jgi:uncharacterized protein (TIGR02594 family)
MNEPLWLQAARRDIGQRETTGPNDSPWLRRILKGYAWLIGTPWCGGAVRHWMGQAGIEPPRHWYRARAWLEWGRPIASPCLGCVAVFARFGGGHVGLVVGRDQRGRLLVLGGNQGDAVSVAPFDMARVLGYRVPPDHSAAERMPIPTLASVAASSSNEA